MPTHDIIQSFYRMSEPLTPIQKAAVDAIHDEIKDLVSTLAHLFSENIITTITKIIGETIRLVQGYNVANTVLTGSDKKRVVVEVIRLAIQDCIQDKYEQTRILAVFDEIADTTINVMINVSHGLQELKKEEEKARKMMEDAQAKTEQVKVEIVEKAEIITSACGACIIA